MVDSVKILKSLADPIRLELAKYIASKDQGVYSCDAVKACAKRMALSQPAMSHHYSRLVDAGVLLVEKDGIENLYTFNRKLLEKIGIDINKL